MATNEDMDKYFHKLFLGNITSNSVKKIGNRRMQVIIWVIQHLSLNNELKDTYRQISEKTGISYQTVARTMKDLIDADVLRKSGKILIANPDIIFKGPRHRRDIVKQAYNGATIHEKQIRISQLKAQIANLSYEASCLSADIQHEEQQLDEQMEKKAQEFAESFAEAECEAAKQELREIENDLKRLRARKKKLKELTEEYSLKQQAGQKGSNIQNVGASQEPSSTSASLPDAQEKRE